MSKNFEQLLQQYAEVLVRVGSNVEAGKDLELMAPVTNEPVVRQLVHQVTAAAYDAGARLVNISWRDEVLTKIRLEHADPETIDAVHPQDYERLHAIVEAGGSLLSVRASDPDLMKGQDAKLMAKYRKPLAELRKPTRKLWNQGIGTWSLGTVAFQEWADKVLPDLPAEKRVAKLWDLIFQASRVTGDDPVADWQAHAASLIERAKYLTDKQYTALKYTAPGTDLTIGLADNHIWLGGGDTTQEGRHYIPNIPTEEVFTMPHRERVNGTVTATKPLNYGGALIENFSMTFKDGCVVDFKASAGEDVLREMLATDDGAKRLGEVALVPNSSPISQMNVLFYNTLYDENASCHIALGAAYHNTMENGPFMSEDDFEAAGGNSSLVHTDFMIGSGALDIDGVLADDSTEAIMRQGEWAFSL